MDRKLLDCLEFHRLCRLPWYADINNNSKQLVESAKVQFTVWSESRHMQRIGAFNFMQNVLNIYWFVEQYKPFMDTPVLGPRLLERKFPMLCVSELFWPLLQKWYFWRWVLCIDKEYVIWLCTTVYFSAEKVTTQSYVDAFLLPYIMYFSQSGCGR